MMRSWRVQYHHVGMKNSSIWAGVSLPLMIPPSDSGPPGSIKTTRLGRQIVPLQHAHRVVLVDIGLLYTRTVRKTTLSSESLRGVLEPERLVRPDYISQSHGT